MQHFINLNDFSQAQLNEIIDQAIFTKKNKNNQTPLANQTLAMIFDKPSTRTRVSFQAGIAQLGGQALFLSSSDLQLGRGETIQDTARVIGSMVDIIALRVSSHQNINTFAQYANVPIINALSDESHPCQILADLMTYQELRGTIKNKTVAWLGDGNNVCQTYIQAATLFDFKLNIAVPEQHLPCVKLLKKHQKSVNICKNAKQAVRDADLVITDVWQSMPAINCNKKQNNKSDFFPYQVNQELMALAKKDALFSHCLPAHRDEEVTDSVLEGKQSMAWQAAENRLHAQKALLLKLLKQ